MDITKYLNDIVGFFKLPIWRNLIYGFISILVIIWLAFIYWTYRDARLRNTSAIFWAAIVLIFNFLGLIVYLILRPPEFIEDVVERDLEIKRMEILLDTRSSKCPTCSREIGSDFVICPYCRKKLKKECIQCEKPLNMDWKVCPYCKTEQ